MAARAFITGLSGPALTADERAFLREARPWGLILFKRNIEDKAQVTRLVQDFLAPSASPTPPSWSTRRAAGCSGWARRIGRPIRPARPMARSIERDKATGLRAAWLGARLIAADLKPLGINVDCLPLADVPVRGADQVIGDRAYGETPDQVAALAAAVAQGLQDGGVLPVLKHIPGHGRANADSHRSLRWSAPREPNSRPPILPHSGRSRDCRWG